MQPLNIKPNWIFHRLVLEDQTYYSKVMVKYNACQAADIIDLSSQNNLSTSKPVTFRSRNKKRNIIFY